MIFNVRGVRVTLVAVRTLYPLYSAQMTNVIIKIFPSFKPLPALNAVQIARIVKSSCAFHTTNLGFLIARVLQMVGQVPMLEKRLAALRTSHRVHLRTGQRVGPF